MKIIISYSPGAIVLYQQIDSIFVVLFFYVIAWDLSLCHKLIYE